jgi:hypothetical protein
MNCKFDDNTLSYEGDPVDQARCLLRRVKKFRILDSAPAALPPVLEHALNGPMSVTEVDLRGFLGLNQISEEDIGGRITDQICCANLNKDKAHPALYFVVHDTSDLLEGQTRFLSDINTNPAKNGNNVSARASKTKTHVLINRLGKSVTAREYNEVSRPATKFELAKPQRQGRYLHHELVQPRISDPGKNNDAVAPVPGFTPAQYDRLALLYVVASFRAKRWLIPGFHGVIDDDFGDKAHDDPQNFDLSRFGTSLDALLENLHTAPPTPMEAPKPPAPLAMLVLNHGPAGHAGPVAVISYEPPPKAAERLGNILQDAVPEKWERHLDGLKALFRLPGNELYIDAGMQIDTDGSPKFKDRKLDPHWQRDTAMSIEGKAIDADQVPYVVLPGSSEKRTVPKKDFFYTRMGLRLGDVAAVIWDGKVRFAVLGDAGPNDSIGEASIRLVKSLGRNPFGSGGLVNNGVDRGVIYIVFPGSTIPSLTATTAEKQINEASAKLFIALGGSLKV